MATTTDVVRTRSPIIEDTAGRALGAPLPPQGTGEQRTQVWLEFSDSDQNPPIRRRVGLKGEETIR